jgi:hypothetical protein
MGTSISNIPFSKILPSVGLKRRSEIVELECIIFSGKNELLLIIKIESDATEKQVRSRTL